MKRPISLDLRQRILASYDQHEGTREEIAQRFRVSLGMVKKLLQQRRQSGDIACQYHRCGRRPRRHHQDGSGGDEPLGGGRTIRRYRPGTGRAHYHTVAYEHGSFRVAGDVRRSGGVLSGGDAARGLPARTARHPARSCGGSALRVAAHSLSRRGFSFWYVIKESFSGIA